MRAGWTGQGRPLLLLAALRHRRWEGLGFALHAVGAQLTRLLQLRAQAAQLFTQLSGAGDDQHGPGQQQLRISMQFSVALLEFRMSAAENSRHSSGALAWSLLLLVLL